MPSAHETATASISQALETHFRDGLIRGWRPMYSPPRIPADRWEVALSDGSYAELLSVREATMFVHALTSAHQGVRGHALAPRGDACGECGLMADSLTSSAHPHQGRL
jgi:hypothetical protein